MPSYQRLVREVNSLYRDYSNINHCHPSFSHTTKSTLLKLIILHQQYDNGTRIPRPPTPAKKILRGEAHDLYKSRMRSFFAQTGAGVSVNELSVPQTEIVANFLAGIKHPQNQLYAHNYDKGNRRIQKWESKLARLLSEYACEEFFPVCLTAVPAQTKRHILDFMQNHVCRCKIRPALPKQKKLFLNDYYQYRLRAQEFFDKAGLNLRVEVLTLAAIEALMNFIVGRKKPDSEMYNKVFLANAVSPVESFVSKYKPYENHRYPISVGQYHGRKNEISPLLFFKPIEYIERWFSPPKTNKIKRGRTRLFLNYRVFFERLNIEVDPMILPIAYIEAVLGYAQATASRQMAVEEELVQRTG